MIVKNGVYFAQNGVRIPLAETEKKGLRGQEDRPLTALEAVTHESRIALLGDPGSARAALCGTLTAVFIRGRSMAAGRDKLGGVGTEPAYGRGSFP